MRYFKVILGLACVIVALPLLPFALAIFSHPGMTPPAELLIVSALFLGIVIGLFWAGWFLVAKRNSPISKVTMGIIITTLLVGFFPTAWLISHPVESRYRTGEAYWQTQNLAMAIWLYEDEFHRLPVPANISKLTNEDFTFGTYNTSVSALGITNSSGYQANNSEIVAILRTWTNCPDFVHSINIKTQFPCIDTNGVLLDPWGHPIIVTVHLKTGEDRSRDAFYRLASVSETDPNTAEGFNHFVRPTPPPYNSDTRDSFENAESMVMVWSLGPDGKANRLQKADAGVNKDNILRTR